MPRAPKVCAQCANTVPCPTHTPKPWAGKQPWHSRGFPKPVRQTILRRDNWTCQHCGHRDPTGRTLEADHITSVAEGGTHNPANGRTLCTTCHQPISQQQAAQARWH